MNWEEAWGALLAGGKVRIEGKPAYITLDMDGIWEHHMGGAVTYIGDVNPDLKNSDEWEIVQ